MHRSYDWRRAMCLRSGRGCVDHIIIAFKNLHEKYLKMESYVAHMDLKRAYVRVYKDDCTCYKYMIGGKVTKCSRVFNKKSKVCIEKRREKDE